MRQGWTPRGGGHGWGEVGGAPIKKVQKGNEGPQEEVWVRAGGFFPNESRVALGAFWVGEGVTGRRSPYKSEPVIPGGPEV